MQRTVLFKKFLMPCGLCAAVPAMKPVNPSEDHTLPCNAEQQAKKLIKPSELPIYSMDDGYTKQMPCIEYPAVIEENIRKVRKTVHEIKVTINIISSNFTNTVERFKFIIDYLQDEANLIPRLGAVGAGGLSGLMLGLRGGMFKRLFYTTTGASIVGCICFPKEAKETFNVLEHYGNIGYNFVCGASENPVEDQLTESCSFPPHSDTEDHSKPLDSVTSGGNHNKDPKFKEFKTSN